MNTISPTGCVHAIESRDGWGVTTLCHHTNFGVLYSELDWGVTPEPVTCKRCLLILHANDPKVTKIIHVNQHVIKHNLKCGVELPPCRVQEGSKSRYCREVQIQGPSRMVYHPNDPLSCGARLWIETESDVELIGEVQYSDIREAIEANRFTTLEK